MAVVVRCWECGKPMDRDEWHGRYDVALTAKGGIGSMRVPGYGVPLETGDVMCKRCHVIQTHHAAKEQQSHKNPQKPCKLCTPERYSGLVPISRVIW